jgi:hypothetical protein
VEQIVPERTLSFIFDQHGINHIDFLSLDIEGYEVQALKGLDLGRHRPHIMVIESDTPEHTRQINDLLVPAGYHVILEKNINIFYSVDSRDRDKVINLYNTIELTRAGHPLDGESDRKIRFTVDTRTKSAFRVAAVRFKTQLNTFIRSRLSHH